MREYSANCSVITDGKTKKKKKKKKENESNSQQQDHYNLQPVFLNCCNSLTDHYTAYFRDGQQLHSEYRTEFE